MVEKTALPDVVGEAISEEEKHFTQEAGDDGG